MPSSTRIPYSYISPHLQFPIDIMSQSRYKAARKTSQWPWQRRKSEFARPTLLDRILESPIKILLALVYAILLKLRGAPFKPPKNKPPIRIVCISDTHTNTGMEVPNGDLLIHAGDLTNAGTIEEIQKQIDWLNTLPHKEKIVICGNHDSYFDPSSRKAEDRKGPFHWIRTSWLHIHRRDTISITGLDVLGYLTRFGKSSQDYTFLAIVILGMEDRLCGGIMGKQLMKE